MSLPRSLFRVVWQVIMTSALLAGWSVASAAVDAQGILAASDAVRNPGRAFSVVVGLTEFLDGKRVDSSSMVTYSRQLAEGGQYATIVKFLSPARDSGKLMLKDGRDLWFFDPTTKASVRLSPQQRLLGQASNGDVVTVNLARDYRASHAGEEELQDGERKVRRTHKLALEASTSDATYSRIELWVGVDNNWPIKGLFYAESGRLLKTVFYRKFQPQLGLDRPTELVIIDGVNPASVTLMRLTDFASKALPVSWFQRDHLPRFQVE